MNIFDRHYLGVSAIVVYIGTIEINEQVQRIPMVARVSIVDYRGDVVLDTYVQPTHKIEDYRSQETGIYIHDLINAPSFQEVQLRVSSIVKNKILVGHCLWTFLSVLGLSHPALYTRDLALFRPMRRKLKSRVIVSLPILVHKYMGCTVLELARVAMDLFRCCERDFEKIIEDGGWPCNLPPSAFAEYFT
ncbi:RNA exonuclease 4 [Termitomyces sp. J132]|nr:RNA exonuclease 4 [Termitomyces sp. J132]